MQDRIAGLLDGARDAPPRRGVSGGNGVASLAALLFDVGGLCRGVVVHRRIFLRIAAYERPGERPERE